MYLCRNFVATSTMIPSHPHYLVNLCNHRNCHLVVDCLNVSSIISVRVWHLPRHDIPGIMLNEWVYYLASRACGRCEDRRWHKAQWGEGGGAMCRLVVDDVSKEIMGGWFLLISNKRRRACGVCLFVVTPKLFSAHDGNTSNLPTVHHVHCIIVCMYFVRSMYLSTKKGIDCVILRT